VQANALGNALDRIAVLDAEQRLKLAQPVLDAHSAFRSGHGTAAHWMQLADAMRVGEVLAERRLFPGDQLQAYVDAQHVLGDVSDRHNAGGSWTLRRPELERLALGVDYHQAQLDAVSQGELLDAVETVKRRARAALAGNASPKVRLCMPGLLGCDLAHLSPAQTSDFKPKDR